MCGLTAARYSQTAEICDGISFMLNVSPAQCEYGCKHGDCVGPNKCKCFPGYTGKTCNQGGYLRSVKNVWKTRVKLSPGLSDYQLLACFACDF